MSVCICTGCELYDPVHRRMVRGDLFSLGQGAFVFNAATTGTKCEPAWRWNVDPPDNHTVRAVVLLASSQTWFERRGVFTMLECGTTEALRAYVDQSAIDLDRRLGGG